MVEKNVKKLDSVLACDYWLTLLVILEDSVIGFVIACESVAL